MDVTSSQTSSSLMVEATISYNLGQFTTISASGGMSYVDDRLRHVTRFGPYVRASISHTAAQAVFGTSYDQSFVPSFGFGGSTRSQQASGWIDLPPIGHRLYLQGSGLWRRTTPFDKPQALRSTRPCFAGDGGLCPVAPDSSSGRLHLHATGLHRHGGEVNRNRIGVELVLFNPMRIP